MSRLWNKKELGKDSNLAEHDAVAGGVVARLWPRRARRMPYGFVVPLMVLMAIIVAATAAPLLTPYGPIENNLADGLMPPVWVAGGEMSHLLGTDGLGRDILTRLLHGARVSLGVAMLSLLIAVTLGTIVGVISGYFGGAVDSVLMRIVDMIMSLPLILIALSMAIALGPSFRNLVLVIGFLVWPRMARLIRSETLALKQQEFSRYARAIGIARWRIMLRHILPNVVPTMLVAVTLEIPDVILLEAGLSFLGGGMPPPEASWGVMISDGRALIATGWWIALFPGLAIMTSVVSFNMLGDWLRDRFDPKLREM